MILKPFGKLIRKKRFEKDFRLRHVADHLGVSPTAIYKYEEGESYPVPPLLEKLCALFDLNLQEIQKMIKEERGKEKVQRKQRHHLGLSSAKYQGLREALLETYQSGAAKNKYTPYENKSSSREFIRKEFKKFSVHPFERKLLEEIYKRLTKDKLINPGVESIELFTESSKKNILQKMKKIGFHWSYEPEYEYVFIGFKSGYGRVVGTKWELGWQETENKSKDFKNAKK